MGKNNKVKTKTVSHEAQPVSFYVQKAVILIIHVYLILSYFFDTIDTFSALEKYDEQCTHSALKNVVNTQAF